MKNNITRIAEGNTHGAVAAYRAEIQSRDWMKEVDENNIYAQLGSPEFAAYMDILGLGELEDNRRNAA